MIALLMACLFFEILVHVLNCINKSACENLSPPQRFKRSLYQSAVRSVPQAQSRAARCMSISRTSLSFSHTSMNFSALAKFDSLKLTETHC